MSRANIKIVMMAIILLGTAMMFSTFAESGDATDPLITLSYLDMRLDEITAPSGGGATFNVIQVFDGETLTLGGSAEAILRSGKATAFVSARGGLADVTSGRDLQQGETVPTNHLIICPLDDGRGFEFHSEAWVMVKGDYQIR